MGVSKHGKISLVTNYRDLKNLKSVAPSRGKLVSDFLLNDSHAQEYLETVSEKGQQYNGFNLIVGTPDELHYYSNYKEKVERIPDGLHGLCNNLLNVPWPKVTRGIDKMKPIVEKEKIDVLDLFDVLNDDHLAADTQLPDTGLDLERERALSSMFIKSPGYGTRCSTVILVDRNQEVLFSERVYDVVICKYTTRSFRFKVLLNN
jgi:uncharacterized protein with NRDE domain